MSEDFFMKRALELAKKGEGAVDPNPKVGAVIVKDNVIIGEGYHEMYGGLHAERNAIADAKKKGNDIKGADMYVTLEPCCHYGKTPPCTQAVMEEGIKRVFIGSSDPNPRVAGKGVKLLEEAGIEVREGILKEECDSLNKVFFKYITEKKPYVVSKYAMTADGKINMRPRTKQWLSGEEAGRYVHNLRNKYMGIMVGIGTVLTDNPMLNCRLDNGRDPVRIICDSTLKIPPDCNIVKTARDYKTIVATACAGLKGEKIRELTGAGIRVVDFPDANGRVDLEKLISFLSQEGISSILLEGGPTLHGSMFKMGLVDEVVVIVTPRIFGGGGLSPVEGMGAFTIEEAAELRIKEMKAFDKDIIINYEVIKNK